MKKRFQFKWIVSALMLAANMSSNAADGYLSGSVTNLTSFSGGLLVMLDNGVPGNCTGTPYNWMLVKAENKVMIATVLTMYSMGKKGATVYTHAYLPGNYCEINQYDPVE